MLRIRFKRIGKKSQPSFRMVVTEKSNPAKGGRSAEEIGFYNPLTKEGGIKADRVKYWLKMGAQPSDSVYNFLVSKGILTGKKRPVHAKAKARAKQESNKQ